LDGYLAKFEEYLQALELTEIKDGLKRAMELSSIINKYLQDEKAWEKEQLASKRLTLACNSRSDQILGVAVCAIRLLSAVLEPYMPSLSAKINFMLGYSDRTVKDDTLLAFVADAPNRATALLSLVPAGQQLNEPVSLFRPCRSLLLSFRLCRRTRSLADSLRRQIVVS
jgi:methionyl-tRNA synthetase